MMFEHGETLDGITWAIKEIDDELTTHIPELKRRCCTPRVMAEVDELLDTRNDLTYVLGSLTLDEELEEMSNGAL
jgi:hypothetical protein